MIRSARVVITLILLTAAAPALAQQAPIVDRELFFGDPEISGGQISPDGQFITFVKPYRGVRNIWVKRVDAAFDDARPLTADSSRPVTGYFWTHDSRYVLFVQDRAGNENFRVYVVDPAAPAEAATGVPPARDLTPYENIRAAIYAVPRATPDQIIVGLNDRDPQLHDVYRIDINTGERELIIRNDENVAGWMTDNDGTVRMAVRLGPDGETQILRVDGEMLTEVYTCSNEETCGPIRFHQNGRQVYMRTDKGADVNLSRLILLDPETGEETFVESDPEDEVDFAGAAFSDLTGELQATFYVGDRVRIYPKTDVRRRDLELLRSKLPEGEISFGSSTADEKKWLVRVARDVDPGSTYLYDRETGDVELLYRSRPELPSEHLAPMRPVRYTARDGLEIHAYLTLPKGVEPRNLPVVILPHGGPWARDVWGYDGYAQYLANRGYAVFQPNFRGSTGYGKRFLNAGNKEWGTGAMQHDITDGVQYLIDEGIADPTKVGIFGASYGGYATLAGLAFTPEVYAAGISYVGPSNLITLLNSIPPYWAPVKKMFDLRLGDQNDPADAERLKAQSPLFSADQIRAPLLVIQGANDPRVNRLESEQIVVALRDLGRHVEYMLAEDEGHGFAGRENRIAVAAAMERFLAPHLGGRFQEDMPEDIANTLAKLTVDVNTIELPETGVAAAAAVAPLPTSDGDVIEPQVFEYNITIEAGGQEIAFAITRTIEAGTLEGREVWRIIDVLESPMGSSIDSLELDRASLRPLRRAASGMGSIQLRFTDTEIVGEVGSMGQKIPVQTELTAPVFADGAGTDIVLAGLPLAEGYETTIRTFDAQMQRIRPMKVAVTGTATVETGSGTHQTFVVEMTPLDGDPTGTATLHVMLSAPHHVVTNSTRLPAAMGSGIMRTELNASYQRRD